MGVSSRLLVRGIAGVSVFVLAIGGTGVAAADIGDDPAAAPVTAAPTPATAAPTAASIPEADEVATAAPEATGSSAESAEPSASPSAKPSVATPEAEPGGAVQASAGAPIMPAASAAQPAGTVLFRETFGLAAATPVMLNAFGSASGATYTAAAYWLDAAYCNGFVMHADMNVTKAQINSTYCGPNGGNANSAQSEDDYGAVRTKAFALGKLAGLDDAAARRNGTLSTNTSGGRPSTDLNSPDSVLFRTVGTPVRLPDVGNRFLSVSLDSAAQCGDNGDETANAPRLSLWLLAGDQTRQLTSAPVNVCDRTYAHVTGWTLLNGSNSTIQSLRRQADNSLYASWVYPVRVGSYFGDQSFLVDSETDFGLLIRNTSAASSTGRGAGSTAGTANGNDGAIDNLSIVDVTPWLEKSFSPARVPVGSESTLTLTIRNTTERAEKRGWSFVDTLPDGLTVVDPARQVVTGSCLVNGGAQVSLTADSIAVAAGTGWLQAGVDRCTIVVRVTSAAEGVYTNDTFTNVGDRVGIDPGNAADVEFYYNTVLWQKVDNRQRLLAGSEWTLTGPTGGSSTTRTVRDCVAEPCPVDGLDADPAAGRLRVASLPDGDYLLTETKAPERYQISSSPRYLYLGGGAAAGIDIGPIENLLLPEATVVVRKLVQDVAGGEPGPGEGWTVGVTLNPGGPWGLTLAPSGTQVTGADGTPADPWRLRFADSYQTAAVTVSEAQQDGFSFESGTCTITGIDDTTRTVAFGDDGVAQLTGLRAGDAAVCELTNRQLPGEVTWSKVDDTGAANPLAGSDWQLTGPDGVVLDVTDCDADTAAGCAGRDLDERPGQFRVSGLAWGDHQLVETRAPAGYYLNSEPHQFTIDSNNLAVALGAVVNEQRKAPVLPLTGGLGRDGVLLLGLGVIALGLGAAGHLRLRTAPAVVPRRRH